MSLIRVIKSYCAEQQFQPFTSGHAQSVLINLELLLARHKVTDRQWAGRFRGGFSRRCGVNPQGYGDQPLSMGFIECDIREVGKFP